MSYYRRETTPEPYFDILSNSESKQLRARAKLRARIKRTSKKPVKARQNSIKIYEGPSMLDGEPIIAILTGLSKASANPKTGAMLQVWIMPRDVKPNDAVKTGADASVCGNCPLRPLLWKAAEVKPSKRPCYVKTFQAARSVWVANRFLPVTDTIAARVLIGGRKVRLGAWGDPAALPPELVTGIVEGAHKTGYSHQWREHDLSDHVMASVHTLEEREQAIAAGYRTFRIIADVSEIVAGEISCPASKEAGARTTCAKCGLCDGMNGPNDKRKTLAIIAH